MTSGELSWQEAIIRVLEEAGEPLHYQELTRRIGAQRLRDLSGATPANSANRTLNAMTTHGNQSFDGRVRKTGSGIFQFIDPSETDQSENGEPNEIAQEQAVNENSALIPAYGLYWVKDFVSWRSRMILGRQTTGAQKVNFADQEGVYLLHRDNNVVYVGRTSDSLYNRLRSHNNQKNLRWNRFSWFGLREVREDGVLGDSAQDITPDDLITVLESVLIEVLEPPINGRRGDRMGELYEQVIDPQIAKDQAISLLRAAVN